MQESGSGDRLAAEFARWAAAERAAGAAAGRSRLRELTERSAATATWAGVLVDLAERRAQVSIGFADHRATGRLAAVGRDFCVLESGRAPVVVPFAGVSAVYTDATGAPPGGSRPAALALSMVSVYESLSAERSPVVVVCGGARIEGDLVATGEDVLTVRAGRGRLVHVPHRAVYCCELR